MTTAHHATPCAVTSCLLPTWSERAQYFPSINLKSVLVSLDTPFAMALSFTKLSYTDVVCRSSILFGRQNRSPVHATAFARCAALAASIDLHTLGTRVAADLLSVVQETNHGAGECPRKSGLLARIFSCEKKSHGDQQERKLATSSFLVQKPTVFCHCRLCVLLALPVDLLLLSIHHCMGHIETNKSSAVFGSDIQPVAGLREARKASERIRCNSRLGRHFLLDCMVSGAKHM